MKTRRRIGDTGRGIATAMLGLLLACDGSSTAATRGGAEGSPFERGETARSGAPERTQRSASERRAAAVRRRLWWHKEETARMVAVAPEQVERLDELAERAVPELRRLAETALAARDAYRSALDRGDWTAAEAAMRRRSDATRDLATAQSAIVIAGLQQLQQEQRAALGARIPLDRAWIPAALLLPAPEAAAENGTAEAPPEAK